MPENCTWEYIAERVVKEAEYILQTGATVRACANKFGISKSTVHKDVTERIAELNPCLAKQVKRGNGYAQQISQMQKMRMQAW